MFVCAMRSASRFSVETATICTDLQWRDRRLIPGSIVPRCFSFDRALDIFRRPMTGDCPNKYSQTADIARFPAPPPLRSRSAALVFPVVVYKPLAASGASMREQNLLNVWYFHGFSYRPTAWRPSLAPRSLPHSRNLQENTGNGF